MKEKDLNQEIEQSRENLNRLAAHLGITHPEVISESTKLDQLINEYNQKMNPKESFTSFNLYLTEDMGIIRNTAASLLKNADVQLEQLNLYRQRILTDIEQIQAYFYYGEHSDTDIQKAANHIETYFQTFVPGEYQNSALSSLIHLVKLQMRMMKQLVNLITLEEAAEIMCKSPSAVYKDVTSKKLPSYFILGKHFVNRHDVIEKTTFKKGK